jgi:phosphoglycolate phosphatase
MKTCAIFDLDGTLIDSRQDLTDAVNWMRAQFKLPPLKLAQVVEYIGNGAGMLAERSLKGSGVAVEKGLPLLKKYYHDHLVDNTVLYAGVADGLITLLNAGIKLAVITNKPHLQALEVLRKLNIYDSFEMVIGGDSGFPLKPSPEPLLHFVGKCGCVPDSSWMCGDHYTDLEAARRAGMKRCFAAYGFGNPKDEHCEYSVSTFSEFVTLCLNSL